MLMIAWHIDAKMVIDGKLNSGSRIFKIMRMIMVNSKSDQIGTMTMTMMMTMLTIVTMALIMTIMLTMLMMMMTMMLTMMMMR